MSPPPTSNPLESFTRLNSAVYFHQPHGTARRPASRAHDPHLIVLAAWMNALPKHLAKYASKYTTLYPSAAILLIFTNSLDVTIRTHGGTLARVGPVLELLRPLGAGGGPAADGQRVLWHAFSNGGAFTSTWIARSHFEATGRALPAAAVVLDSSPGRANVEATSRAFAVSLPRNPLLNFLGWLLLRLFFAVVRVRDAFRWTPNTIDRIRDVLNDRKCFAVEAPRLYVYSEGDDMVDSRDVEEHGAEADARGYRVWMEKYGGSRHAAHMIDDPRRYWSTVWRLWNSVA
ncbi:hypothetical protein BJ875DRAFT_292066 [Amylocarpus encephaloides]|uniref:Indole-diterpene biosynthesis protein PaxU n=1 Tax=Amylocarpus encephaloides TaxID=45428 RepID=A0A9P7YKQ3_9HELO|nr:hypothetical protein BJ875DRAFT_292066 [Amylocarpus encephaloides]